MRISELLNNSGDGDAEAETKVEGDAEPTDRPRPGTLSSGTWVWQHQYNNHSDDDHGLSPNQQRANDATRLLSALHIEPPLGTSMSSSSSPKYRSSVMDITRIINPDNNNDDLSPDTDEDRHAGRRTSPRKRPRRRQPTRATSARPLSGDERRARQRMIVKRCYYKKINTIKELQARVHELEKQFNHALQLRQGEKASTDGSDLTLSDLYVNLVSDKEELQRTNRQLRQLADEWYMKNQGRLRLLLESNRKDLQLFTPALTDG